MPRYKIKTTQMYMGAIYEPDAQGFADVPTELGQALEAARKAQETSDEYHEALDVAENSKQIAEVSPIESPLPIEEEEPPKKRR